MTNSVSPTTTENDIVFTESVFAFLKELFLKGSLVIPAAERSLDVLEIINSKSVEVDGDILRFSIKGMYDFRNEYARQINAGLVEVDTLQYFGCMFSERTGDGLDGPAIFGSSEAILEYVKFLQSGKHLNLSDRTQECDYAVLDFIDVETGESYDLYPGDTVVLDGEGYVVHKFSE